MRSFCTLSCIPRPVTICDGPAFSSAWVRWGLFRALCHWVCLISSRLGETNSRCRSMNWTVLKTVNYTRTSQTEEDGLYTIQALQRFLKSAITSRVFCAGNFYSGTICWKEVGYDCEYVCTEVTLVAQINISKHYLPLTPVNPYWPYLFPSYTNEFQPNFNTTTPSPLHTELYIQTGETPISMMSRQPQRLQCSNLV